MKDESAASSMESKGSIAAELNKLVRWGSALGSYKEKWTISQKNQKAHLRYCLYHRPLRVGRMLSSRKEEVLEVT